MAMLHTLDRSRLDRTLLVCLIGLIGASSTAAENPPPVIGAGELRSLSVIPDQIVLRGADRYQQMMITGHFANGGVRDLTWRSVYRVTDSAVIRVERDGLVVALKNGAADVTIEVEGRSVKVPVTVEDADREQSINFTNEIVPIFSKLGCNSGACHGKATGQNGFKLSLLGFEPREDYDALVLEGRGRRVHPAVPEASLLLIKPIGAIAHGGGKRLDPTSRDFQLLLRWIRAGLPFGKVNDPKVTGITITPGHRLIGLRSTQQITVIAQYSDGSRRDVTPQAEFSSNDTELVGISETGLVETRDRPGEGSVMARYLGHVAVFRATIPQDVPADKLTFPVPANYVDEHVFAKLTQLGIPPSDLCSDSEFLRRVSLDITGTLPTAAEAEKFLADKDPTKREKLIDDLLSRPAYASYFSLKWGDILRNRQKGMVGVGGGATRTIALHDWIRDSLKTNKPYDQFVREILTATGDFTGINAQPPVGWYNVLRTPQMMVDDTAQVFLGTRIQCAQCHHHPYEKWSQDDYWSLAAFFARTQLGNTTPKGKGPPAGGQKGLPVVVVREGHVTSPQGKAYANPRPLDGEMLNVPAEQDPRHLLTEWMVRPDNPFFARALVNRYWAHFFGRGIVEMPDDLRVTNPPSNPALLDALAKDFSEHKHDLKQPIRTICTSKTYQLSSSPNEYNAKDKQNFARYYPRRLAAEALVDAIDQVTGVPTIFGSGGKVSSARAIDLPDEAFRSPLLAAFGKPERSSACECERSPAVTLSQSLLLISSPDVHNKLKNPKSRAGLLAADSRPTGEKIKEVYLLVYSRLPTAEELKIAEAYLAQPATVSPSVSKPQAAAARQLPYEDFLWALMNTKEFLFNH